MASEAGRIFVDAIRIILCAIALCGIVENVNKIRNRNERSGCEYCSGEVAEYQHTINTKLYINTFGAARTLVTECNPCPPYAECCMKGNPARSAFIINYCPNCGKKLDGGKDNG